jgi:glucosyl-3-phosphoglycerate synthase
MTPRTVALVPARNEADRVGETVRSLAHLVDEVVVVDDGSGDLTASRALAAGATVLRIPGHAGKGAAMEGALRRLGPADLWLFADADLGASADGLGALLEEVRGGRADLAIAVFPPQQDAGLGTVKRFAQRAIHTLAGIDVQAPLSGQRAITAACLAAVRPLAPGFGLETGMTIDAVRRGFRVIERTIPGLTHRPTGRRLRGFAHRGRQGLDILRAVLRRAVRRR